MDRNVILAIVLSAAVLLGWELTFGAKQREALEAERAARQAAEQTQAAEQIGTAGTQDLAGISPGDAGSAGEIVDVAAAIEAAPGRIQIDTPSLDGSINLRAGRIDDLNLKNYRETLDADSPEIRLLSPRAAEHGHYLEQGWFSAGASSQDAIWQGDESAVLSPSNPVTLSVTLGDLLIERTISVDETFMFTVTDRLVNRGDAPVTATPYGLVVQRSIPEDFRNFLILHEGPLAIVDKSLFELKYKKARSAVVEKSGERGWIGITNKYWLAAAVPPQGENFKVDMRNIGTVDAPVFRVTYTKDPLTIPAGGTAQQTAFLFGGAKDVDVLQSYEQSVEDGGLGVWDFDKAVDWGNFWFLTRPIFYTLNFFGDLIGNFGVAILVLTLIIKAFLFPLANKAYDSMSKMKKLQPELKKLQERHKDDKMKLQQEMMALYQKEKMNPLAGCLPVIVQMPIFYALYKTLFVTIELRHKPFFGWIQDLSAPDPTTVFNLFGLLPYDPTVLPLIGGFLGIGVLPLLMGFSMWFQMKLNPPAPDPVQQQIFTMMPIVFTFLFASFAAGLVLYWFWNTALSILQQWAIMKKNGVSIDWGERLPFLGGGKKAGADTARK